MSDKIKTPQTAQKSPIPVRYPAQVELLRRAVAGDPGAVNLILQYLSSTIPDLRKLMQNAIHDWHHTRLWQHMLRCLALHRWGLTAEMNIKPDCSRRSDPGASARIDDAIIEVFVNDESPAEYSAKLVVLRLGLANPEVEIRHASACILGMRGDLEALPFLDNVIQYGEFNWKIRAIAALAALDDESCGASLVRALAHPNRLVHQAAGRAISEIGVKAEPALAEALNDPDHHVRWHVAQALGTLGDPRAVHVLAEGLVDSDKGVRWASANALAGVGSPAVVAILEVIRNQPMNEQLRQVVYHALHAMPIPCRKKLHLLIEALSSPVSSITSPAIASRMLIEVNCDD